MAIALMLTLIGENEYIPVIVLAPEYWEYPHRRDTVPSGHWQPIK